MALLTIFFIRNIFLFLKKCLFDYLDHICIPVVNCEAKLQENLWNMNVIYNS